MSIFYDGKGEREVRELVKQHLDVVRECISNVPMMIKARKEDELPPREYSFKIHSKEKEADTLRRKILALIEKGAFLPTIRGELLSLMERVDGIANAAESVGDYYILFEPDFSESEKEQLLQICDKSCRSYDKLEKALSALFENFNLVVPLCTEIEALEEEVDKIEWYLNKEIFSNKDSLAMNILKRDFIKLLCDISDRMENASDVIEILVVKRKA